MTDWSQYLQPRPYLNQVSHDLYLRFVSEVGWSQITEIIWSKLKDTSTGLIWDPGIMIDYESQNDKYKVITKQWFPINYKDKLIEKSLIKFLKKNDINCIFLNRFEEN